MTEAEGLTEKQKEDLEADRAARERIGPALRIVKPAGRHKIPPSKTFAAYAVWREFERRYRQSTIQEEAS